jgi:hypothetical protein
VVVRVRVDIEGYARMMRKLRHDEAIAGPWAAAMRTVEHNRFNKRSIRTRYRRCRWLYIFCRWGWLRYNNYLYL